MAVSDDRRNTEDATSLVRHALECVEPAESSNGRDYDAVIIQPGTNPDLERAAVRMGFRELNGGYWWRRRRNRRA